MVVGGTGERHDFFPPHPPAGFNDHGHSLLGAREIKPSEKERKERGRKGTDIKSNFIEKQVREDNLDLLKKSEV